MVRKFALVLAAALSSASPALADEWIYVAHTSDEATYLSMKSLRRTGSRVIFWLERVYATPRTDGTIYTMVQQRADCDSYTLSLLALSYYNSAGRAVESHTFESYEQKAEAVVPESVGMAVVDTVCGTNPHAMPVSDPKLDALSRF